MAAKQILNIYTICCFYLRTSTTACSALFNVLRKAATKILSMIFEKDLAHYILIMLAVLEPSETCPVLCRWNLSEQIFVLMRKFGHKTMTHRHKTMTYRHLSIQTGSIPKLSNNAI